MKLKEKYHAFKEWQKRPYQVAPLNPQEHTCATCGTTFHGNYCPRCGQSSRIGRYSLKSTFLLFLDVWGLGNRGMFRSIRDLMFRPGYMIRDYLSGMQMAYFPPFKMYFLLIAFSMLVDGGLNIKGENRIDQAIESYQKGIDVVNEEKADVSQEEPADENEVKKQKMAKEFQMKFIGTVRDAVIFVQDHQTIIMLVWLLALSLPLFLFFCHSPAYSDFGFPEFFVAMIYITNMTTIVSIIMGLFCVNEFIEVVLCYLCTIMALKQLSGYSYLRTFLSHGIAFVTLMMACFMIAFAGVVLYGVFIGFMSVQ